MFKPERKPGGRGFLAFSLQLAFVISEQEVTGISCLSSFESTNFVFFESSTVFHPYSAHQK